MADTRKGCPALSQDLANIAFATIEIQNNTQAVIDMQAQIKAETKAVSQTVDKANQAVDDANKAVATATKAADDAQAIIQDIDNKGFATQDFVETKATDVSNQTYAKNAEKERKIIPLDEDTYPDEKRVPKRNEIVIVRPEGLKKRSSGTNDYYIKIGDGVTPLESLPYVNSPDGVKVGELYAYCDGFNA